MKTKFKTSQWLATGLLLTCLCAPAPAADGADSGGRVSQIRDIGDFSKIKLSGSPDLHITVGPATSVEVIAEEDVLPLIVTETEGNTLKIHPEKSFRSRRGVDVRITTPALDAVSINGSGDVQVTGIRSDEFVISINGSGDAKLNGTTGTLVVQINGSGDVHAGELKATDTRVRIRGSGDASVQASNSLDASVNGSGDVACFGNPARVEKSVRGSGEIKVH